MDLSDESRAFFDLVKGRSVEIYNEFSFQHEFGIHLRTTLCKGLKVQFERPADYFPITPKGYVKTEIDIAIFGAERCPVAAIELKFPRNGQYPEQMFEACKDIMFLEQLVEAGFGRGLFMMAVDDHRFWEGREQSGVYAYFRGHQPIHGVVWKPTGKRDSIVSVEGSYVISWENAGPNLRYCVIEVGSGTGERASPVAEPEIPRKVEAHE